MHKKDKKTFKASPTIKPRLTIRNKWTDWRASETKKLAAQTNSAVKNLVLKSLLQDQTIPELDRDRLYFLRFSMDKHSFSSKPKNYCYYIGRSRSISRTFFMSRHMLRKFARFGMIPGLLQERC